MRESFSRWLALREPLDIASRSDDLAQMLIDRLSQRAPLRIVDLGTGTGSNVRYLIDRLPGRQHWLLVDYEEQLLTEVPLRLTNWARLHGYTAKADGAGLRIDGEQLECRLEPMQLDLSTLPPELFADRDLVTASALLDLASERWLQQLAAACAASGVSVLFALTYSGEVRCTPGEPEDDEVITLVNRHQRGDKGFGPAAGPAAAEAAANAFTGVGYVVRRERSDWTLTAAAATLQNQLIEGWHDAAVDIAPHRSTQLTDWLNRRLAHVEAGRSEVIVSHEDLAAWPA